MDARQKIQAADTRHNWLDQDTTYYMPIGSTATKQ
jgi:hypothetical protein